MGSISTHSTELVALLIFTVAFLALNFRETEAMNISSGRKLLQTNNVSDTSNQSDDTVRRDPLDHLRKYRGGFNIQNKHYWSSTIFTGIYGYAIGALFLLCGIAYGGFLMITYCCHKNRKNRKLKRPPCDKQCSLSPILLAAWFTILEMLEMGSISTHSTELAALLIFTVAFLALNFRETEAMNISSGRKLLQTNNVSDTSNQSDDTVRRDPLDHLRKYRGGFNIQNKHYWSSTIFTGIYGYAIGALFLLCGIAYGGFLMITYCCHKNRKNRKLKRPPCDKQCSLWPILLAAWFTILAITASGVVLGGGSRFYSRAKTVMNLIIDTASEASETIYETTRAMQEINENLQASNQGTDTSTFLTSSSQKLNSEASNIEKQARKNRRRIQNGLKIVYVVTIVTISINLIALIALSVSGFLKLQWAHYWLTGLCWLMTVLCWLFFGAYYFLGGFAGDVCTAFDNFQQNPYNNTLSSILPCDNLLSAGPVLSDASERIYKLVNAVNANISAIQATLPSNRVQVCNPFSGPPDYQYQSGNCPTNTIKIGDIPEVLKAFTCSGNNNRTCQGGEFISANDYRTVESYSSSLQNLLNVYPKMESLLQCQVVKDAFSEILHKHCGPLKRYDRMVWIALIFLSVVMVKLVLVWVTSHHHEKKCHFSDGSVKPASTTENAMDLEDTNTVTNGSMKPDSLIENTMDPRKTKTTTNSSNPIRVM